MKVSMKKNKLRLRREQIRALTEHEALGALGGVVASNPAVSCDSCTNCTCKPPG